MSCSSYYYDRNAVVNPYECQTKKIWFYAFASPSKKIFGKSKHSGRLLYLLFLSWIFGAKRRLFHGNLELKGLSCRSIFTVHSGRCSDTLFLNALKYRVSWA